MINPDERILRAIVSLEGIRDWEIIRRWIKDSLGQAFLDSATSRPDLSIYPFNSGRAFELKDLVRHIDKSRETLEAIRRGKRREVNQMAKWVDAGENEDGRYSVRRGTSPWTNTYLGIYTDAAEPGENASLPTQGNPITEVSAGPATPAKLWRVGRGRSQAITLSMHSRPSRRRAVVVQLSTGILLPRLRTIPGSSFAWSISPAGLSTCRMAGRSRSRRRSPVHKLTGCLMSS